MCREVLAQGGAGAMVAKALAHGQGRRGSAPGGSVPVGPGPGPAWAPTQDLASGPECRCDRGVHPQGSCGPLTPLWSGVEGTALCLEAANVYVPFPPRP